MYLSYELPKRNACRPLPHHLVLDSPSCRCMSVATWLLSPQSMSGSTIERESLPTFEIKLKRSAEHDSLLSFAWRPTSVIQAEKSLSDREELSYSADLKAFCAYCDRRHAAMEVCLAFYRQRMHRHHRWKTVIKEQQSEAKLCNRLHGMLHNKGN